MNPLEIEVDEAQARIGEIWAAIDNGYVVTFLRDGMAVAEMERKIPASDQPPAG
jgi:hypothetical protein